MRQERFLPKLKRALGVVGLVIVAAWLSEPAAAQPYYYQCPPGYAYLAGYGCMPLSYFYGPPVYVYPNYGFGFFYGRGFNRGFNRGFFHGHPHGGHPAGHGGHPGGHGGHGGHR